MSSMGAAVADLVSLRDWLRHGVSRFNEAKLTFGHGSSTAVDDAAFLLLHALHLPHTDLVQWLDCRLTLAERERVATLFDARITTRKPASYLTNTAYIGDFKFYVDERVIVPRSFIGELLVQDGLSDIIDDDVDIETALDLCTGSGCLAILMARMLGIEQVDAVDVSADALAVAKINIDRYELGTRVRLVQSDLFNALAQKRYDLIISNPPYVTADAVQAFPAEYAAEPRLAHLGGTDGLDVVRRIIDEAGSGLTDTGVLICEVGQTRDVLEAAYPTLPFFWIDTEDSEGEVFALTQQDLAGLRTP